MTQPRPLGQTAANELQRLIARYGPDLADQPARLGALLRDLAGQHRLEISLLVAAAESGVAAELVAQSGGGLPEARLSALTRRLEEERGLSAPNARWAVEAWSAAAATSRAEGEPASAGPPPPPVAETPPHAPRIPPAPWAGAEAPPPPLPGADRPTPSRRVLAGVAALALAAGIAAAVFMVVSGSGPLVPPSGVTADVREIQPDGATVVLSWSSKETDARYEIRRDGDAIASAVTSPYSDEGVEWGARHTYEVRASSGDEFSAPATTTVNIATPPVSSAWLSGSISIVRKVVGASYRPNIGNRFTAKWTFDPRCAYPSVCSLEMSDSGTQLRTTFDRDGAALSATADARGFTTCGTHRIPLTSHLVIKLTIDDAVAVAGRWTATQLSGSMHEAFSGAGCRGFYDWTLSDN